MDMPEENLTAAELVDKASILGDATAHLKQLEEHTKMLKEQISQKSVNKSQSSSEQLFEERLSLIEARVSNKDVIIWVHCEKKKGLVVQLLEELEKLNLNIVDTRVLPFGLAINTTIVAKVDADFDMTVKDLVKQLSSTV